MPGLRRKFGSLRRCASGQSLVEMAFVLPMLLTVMLGVFEFGRFYYTRLTLQHAVREATRFAITGNTVNDEESGDPLDRPTSIIRIIEFNTQNLDVDLDDVTITPSDGGGPEEIVRVAVGFTYDLSVPLIRHVVPDGRVNLHFATAMRNEAFYE